ncbi:hypothetical protein ACFVZR_25580 [Streptomyces sp. NPDC058316]|uniref:hypothetical protein n=1 Tax=unclassified Streptomyces TaxID=2593676 RepID=UPI00331C8DA6
MPGHSTLPRSSATSFRDKPWSRASSNWRNARPQRWGEQVWRESGLGAPADIDELQRDLLDVREEGVCASVRDRMVPPVAGRIAETDGRIAELRAFSAHLAGVHDQLSGPAPPGSRLPHHPGARRSRHAHRPAGAEGQRVVALRQPAAVSGLVA